MTTREAMTIVCRELGYSEQQIRDSQQFASLRNPNSEVDKPLVFKQGFTERDLIEGLKESLAKMGKFTPQQQQEFNEALEKRRGKDQERN